MFSFCAESISWSRGSLPDLVNSFVGRDAECEEIIGSLNSNEFRVGVIYGSLGIGKTSLAIAVGHMLQSKGWAVNYHTCSGLEISLDISSLFGNSYQIPNSQTRLKNDKGDKSLSLKDSHPTLLILDQAQNLLEDDQSEIVPKSLQSFLDAALEVRSSRLLFVSREPINLSDDIAFFFKLQPLSGAAAIQLLQAVSQNSSQHDLGMIAESCECNPQALMIVRDLINKGMPEKDIFNRMSSPEHFWENVLNCVKKCHVLMEAEAKLTQSDSLKQALFSLLATKSTVQLQVFLQSWIAGTNYSQEDKVSCLEKASDPRYCHCRLCMRSDEKKSSKLALSSSTSLKGRQLLILIGVIDEF